MPTYINIAPHTKVSEEHVFGSDETYYLPYTSMSIMSLYNKLSKTRDIEIYVYTFDFMYLANEILDRKHNMQNQIIVSGLNINNVHDTMQYLSYKSIKKCNKAILFISDNDYLNGDIYADIKQMHESSKYQSIKIVTENNTIYNVTKKHNYLAYKYKQYSKERSECKLLLEKYQM